MTSPAVCKNGLAVGATLTAPFSGSPEFEAVTERRAGEAVKLTVSGAAPRPGGGPHRALAAAFGPALPLDGSPRRLVVAAPADACAPLTGPGSRYAGALILATRGNCSFAAKAASAGAVGGAGLLVLNNGPGGLVRAAAPATGAPAGPLAPTATLPAASGRDLVGALMAGANLTGVLGREALPTGKRVGREKERRENGPITLTVSLALPTECHFSLFYSTLTRPLRVARLLFFDRPHPGRPH